MTEVIQFALLSLGTGAVYALMGQGIVLIYRGSGVVNFAQGAFAMVGAYSFVEFHQNHGLPLWLSVALALLITGFIGGITNQLIMRRLRNASQLSRLIATLGLVIILQAIGLIRYGSIPTVVPSSIPSSLVHFGSVVVGEDRLWLLGVAVLLTFILWPVSRYTRMGMVITAVAENQRAAAALGCSPNFVATANWTVGAMLAGGAGILIAPLITLQVTSMTLLVIPALAAALIGGFTSYPITMIGAVVLAIAQGEVNRYVSIQGAPDALPLLAIVLVLVVRGQALPDRATVLDRLPSLSPGRVQLRVVIPLVLIVGALTVWILPQTWEVAVGVTMMSAIFLLSVVVLTGYAGQISLAQYAIGGLGAFISGRLVAAQGVPIWAAMIVGVVGAAAIGALFALPALRTRGVSLAVVTLGLGVAAQSVIFDNTGYTGGQAGTTVGPTHLFGVNLDPVRYPGRYAGFELLCFVVCAIVVGNVRRSRAGRRLVAIRSNERAAASVGISVTAAKMFAFIVSSALAGVAGILLGFSTYSIVYTYFDPLSSINIVAQTVVGGVGWLSGPLYGANLASGSLGNVVGNDIFGDLGDWLQLIGGCLLILLLLQDPNGMAANTLRSLRAVGHRLRLTKKTARVAALDIGEPVDQHRVPPKTLIVDGLTVQYGNVRAVQDVSLSVRPGEVVGLIGPNGAGKTTLIDAVTGFAPVMSGTVQIDGRSIEREPAFRRARRGLSRSFQALELFEDVSVLENLRSASDNHDLAAYFTNLVNPRNAPLRAAASAAIREFGLTEDLPKLPTELSYGRRRLLAIARAIASEASIVMLDEPASGLDDVETAELARLIRRLADEWGFSVLLVEHDMDLVMSICDRIVVLEFGQKIAEGIPDDVRTDPAVMAAYLGTDQNERQERSIADPVI